MLLYLRRSDGGLHSADPALCLEVEESVGFASTVTICLSHASDEEKEEQSSVSIMILDFFYILHA